jgi:hypothetical protein
MIRFSCPVCQQHLSARDDGAGQKVSCASCGQRLQIPTTPEHRTHPTALLPPYHPPADRTSIYAMAAVVAVIALKVLPILVLFLLFIFLAR